MNIRPKPRLAAGQPGDNGGEGIHVGFEDDIIGDAPALTADLDALAQRVVVTNHRREAAEELASRWMQLTPDEILESPAGGRWIRTLGPP
jgi:hypothetical protein